MTYWQILRLEMKESIFIGGIMSIIATWVLIASFWYDSHNALAYYSLAVLPSWPVLFVFDAAVAFYVWKNQ